MTSNAKLAQVRALLDKAAATTFPAEADAYRAKAEELMVKYRIEEEQLIAADPVSLKPIWGDTVVSGISPYRTQYFHLFHYIANHCGVEVHYNYEHQDGKLVLVAHTVGYESDLRYAEALYTEARMVFSERLEPQVNRSLPEEDNIYRLRAAGIERVRIADMLWGLGAREDKTKLARIGRVYKAECAKRGEDAAVAGRGVSGAAYREQYAEQFVDTLRVRLRQARTAAAQNGGGVVLHGRQERVKESFYERFPHMRPKPAVEGAKGGEVVQRCDKCAKAKSGVCRDHHIPAGRQSRGRDPFSAAAMRGREAGASAARHVNLGPTGGKELS